MDLDRVTGLRPEWRLGLDGKWQGLEGDNYIEVMAARWNLAADMYLDHNDEMILIRYEDFLKDKIGSIQQLATTLGLKPFKDISSKLDLEYQPRGDRNVTWIKFFGEKNLERIERICGSKMEPFGYPLSFATNLKGS